MESNTFRRLVLGKIATKYRLDSYDLSRIRDYLSSVKVTSNTSIKLAAEYHAKKISELLSSQPKSDQTIDIKAYQTIMLGRDSTDNQPSNLQSLLPVITLELETLFQLEVINSYDLSKQIAPRSKMKYNYLMLDSWNCYEIPETRDKFVWMINDRNFVQQTGYINLHSVLRNIKLARLGRMTFAHVFDDTIDSFSSGRRISFGFDEFASQALIAPDGTKFQFLEQLRLSDDAYGANFILSAYDQNRGWFRFRERFKILDRLSLTIWDLFGPLAARISMPDSYLTFTGIQTFGVTIITDSLYIFTDPLIIPNFQRYMPMIWFWSDSNKKNGPGQSSEQFILSGYTTLDPIGDAAIIAEYNSTHTLRREFLNLFHAPSPLGTQNILFWPTITITVLWKPRFTGVLELVSEDDDDNSPI